MIDQIALGALSSFCYDLLKKGVSNLGDLIKNSSYAKDLNLSDSDVEIIVNKIQENKQNVSNLETKKPTKKL